MNRSLQAAAQHAKSIKRTQRPPGGRNSQMLSDINLTSRTKGGAALDNVARLFKRTETGWSLDRRRSGTTKREKQTNVEQCLWRSTTRGPARSRSLLLSSNIKALKYHPFNSKSQFSRSRLRAVQGLARPAWSRGRKIASRTEGRFSEFPTKTDLAHEPQEYDPQKPTHHVRLAATVRLFSRHAVISCDVMICV